MVDNDGPAFAYTLTVQASDGTVSATVPVTIRVTNVNEPPTANAGRRPVGHRGSRGDPGRQG